MKRIAVRILAIAAVIGGCQGTSASDDPHGPRKVVAERWDTVFMAGGRSVNDTLLAGPNRLALADSVVVVGDDMVARLIGLHARTGRVLWTVGREGGGPGEFRGISDIAVTPAEEPFMELDPGSLALRRSFGLAWPEPVSERVNTRVWLAGSGTAWVSAFWLGPGFTVWQDGAARSHRYRERVPWALRPSPEVTRMGADSARYGALDVEVVDEEIFMLSGGRPVRRAHPGEPTIWIDVYALTGEYDRSYRLPLSADAMATDGRTFYVLASEGIPRLLALRPRIDRGL